TFLYLDNYKFFLCENCLKEDRKVIINSQLPKKDPNNMNFLPFKVVIVAAYHLKIKFFCPKIILLCDKF
ncbi:hypothetical protein BpHYR1_011375, partial [Brachionus plicatilis]